MRSFRNHIMAVSALVLLSLAQAASAFAEPTHVVILGGGVAGMSAAQELAERGFKVTVYEMKGLPGGKARSIPVPGTGTDGRDDLPGEHGFRFFPGFYRHVTDTMKRIPFGNNPNGVFDNLVRVPLIHGADKEGTRFMLPAGMPHSPLDFYRVFKNIAQTRRLNVSHDELYYFAKRLYVFATSSEERRIAEFEKMSWWDFVGAESRSENYKKFLAVGLTRTLVAARADMMSARTAASILLQLIYGAAGQGADVDRVLNAPTNEAWITPWLEHLRNLGVDYHLNAQVTGIEFSAGQVSGATISENGAETHAKADYYISAMPIEAISRLIPENIKKHHSEFSRMDELKTEWMTGIQFFFSEDVSPGPAHSMYFDSPWAVTSIAQQDFWKKGLLAEYGDGLIKGVLSVDVSDWNTPGILFGKPARECSAEEIKAEVLAQIKQHLDPKLAAKMDQSLVTWFLDPGIKFHTNGPNSNEEPLLVNTTNSYFARPEAKTEVSNLFLASDYVRTNTDLATMEGANEAARRAVNAIIDASHSKVKKAELWNLREPLVFAAEKLLDKARFHLGLSHRLDERKSKNCEKLLTLPIWQPRT